MCQTAVDRSKRTGGLMDRDDIVGLLVTRFNLSQERAETVANTVVGALGASLATLPVAAVLTFITGLLGGTHGGGSSDED
jgi:hypothetical protein